MRSSIRRMPGLVAALWLSMMAGGFAAEQEEKTLGDRVDTAVQRFREEAKEVAGEIREGFDQVRGRVDRFGVHARIYARLHWDKHLHDAAITIDVQPGGVAVLRGTVPNELAKGRAGELTESTVGVERVTNELQVASPPHQEH